MFAIGITGMDLSGSQRYFDFSLQHKATFNTGPSRIKEVQNIMLEPCTQAHWSGVNPSITQNYNNLGFNKWLCPSLNSKLLL